MSEGSLASNTEKFYIAGIITSSEFQKSRFIVTKLHKCFPKQYERPEIRSMLNAEWEEHLLKLRRKYGKDLWALKKLVIIFLNDDYLGDDTALLRHVSGKFRFTLKQDWYEIGKCHLIDHLRGIMDKLRQLAYITVSIDHRVVGTMLFELYNDLVPVTCENFLNKCKIEVGGYIGTPVQRILKNSWIQCGGWSLPEKKMRCENYVVPHNRRGVLSMCNDGRHKNNSTQFFITLAPTPWMDYNYVAFGQLIQGIEVLKQIEEVPTYYESPRCPIDIVKCDEFMFDTTPDYMTIEEYREFQNIPNTLLDSLLEPLSDDLVSARSTFSVSKYKQGAYGLQSDMKSYLPFVHLPDYLISDENPEKDEVEDDERQSELYLPFSTPKYVIDKEFYCNSPTLSDTTI